MKRNFIYFGFLVLINSLNANSNRQTKEGQFRAAVFEHELVLPEACLYKVCSREDAINLMEVNLQILESKVIEAAENGAQIILLPEDGIHGYGHENRQNLRQITRYKFFFILFIQTIP